MLTLRKQKMNYDMKRIVKTTNTRILDENGLERVVTTEKTMVHKVETEAFFMTFINYVGWQYDIKSDTAKSVLSRLMELAEFNTGKVMLSPGERKRIIERLGISRVGLYKALNQLLSVGAIAKVYDTNTATGEVSEARGEYMINPEMFWRGELSKRGELIVEFKSIYDVDRAGEVIDSWEETSTSDM